MWTFLTSEFSNAVYNKHLLLDKIQYNNTKTKYYNILNLKSQAELHNVNGEIGLEKEQWTG